MVGAACPLQVLKLSAPSLLPNGDITWLESRPAEGGRIVLVHRQALSLRSRCVGHPESI
jgi:hypothetical protein